MLRVVIAVSFTILEGEIEGSLFSAEFPPGSKGVACVFRYRSAGLSKSSKHSKISGESFKMGGLPRKYIEVAVQPGIRFFITVESLLQFVRPNIPGGVDKA